MNKMQQKRKELMNFMLNTVQGIDGTYRVSQRLESETLNSGDRDAQRKIMGDPVKYIEVRYVGSDINPQKRRASNKAFNRANRFSVSLWREFNEYSQEAFDRICEGDNGILSQLEQLSYFTIDGDTHLVMLPEGVNVTEVYIDSQNGDLAHFLNFNIEIR